MIIAISVILWVLASYGPGDRFDKIDQKYKQPQYAQSMKPAELQRAIKSEKLENSYAGVLGHAIEPAIRPLGFDWKIGIALITSFAAREVFVGTMATIYSVEGSAEKMESVQQKMKTAKKPRNRAAGIYRSSSFFVNDVLCICHAVRQHGGRGLP